MSWVARLLGRKSANFGTAPVAIQAPTSPDHPCRIRSVDDLWGHIAVVVLYAPDAFPIKDFLAADQQMTLDRAFEILKDGVSIAYPEDSFSEKRAWLYAALDRSIAAYRQGDDVGGAHILQDDFQDAIFKKD
ncbi:hypothetical protein D3C72_1607790 [compost metagenome]